MSGVKTLRGRLFFYALTALAAALLPRSSFAYSAEGVASALISLPLKYMHTTVEMVHKEDVENVIALIYEFILQLKTGHDFRYLK